MKRVQKIFLFIFGCIFQYNFVVSFFVASFILIQLPCTLMAQSMSSQEIDIRPILEVRDKFYRDFLEVQRDMNDIVKSEALKAWYTALARDLRNEKVRLAITQKLQNYVLSQRVIDWAGHYQLTGQFRKSANALASYYYMLAAFINELADNPRLDSDQIKSTAFKYKQKAFNITKKVEKCLIQNTEMAGQSFVPSPFERIADSCLKSPELQELINFAKTVLQSKDFKGSNQVLSLTGFVGGNRVEQLVQNFYEDEFIKYMAPMTKKVIDTYSKMTIDHFKDKMTNPQAALSEFFTEKEGFPVEPDNHIIWKELKPNGVKNIYGQIYKALSNAKQSIFIDVFFLGGSIGAMLAKKLIKMVQSNPNLWVYIINDRNNPLGYNNEMAPIFNFLSAYGEKFPKDRLVVLIPEVDLKRTAYPPLAELILQDSSIVSKLESPQIQMLTGQLKFYPKGKSDHSKVVVIDGLDAANGVAFVGSKNFTDTSGGISYDEVTRIDGPAVPVILDSFYYDLQNALFKAATERKAYVKSLAANFSGMADSDDISKMILKILSPVDVLNRSQIDSTKKVLNWPFKGKTLLSVGENNSFGTIRSALAQDIEAIRLAKEQVIISDQFIFEPLVIRSIKEAVQANSNLKIYILLADLANHLDKTKAFSHIPNISFIEEFIENSNLKVSVKWKKIPKKILSALLEVKERYDSNFSPEYHLKSISVDGVSSKDSTDCTTPAGRSELVKKLSKGMPPQLISGSANKDIMTMAGGFREFQVSVYDAAATVDHDCQFWMRFNNPDESDEINLKTMNLPSELVNHGIDENRFNQIIRDIIIGTYNMMNGYFNLKE